jgi:DNA-directed RNA polymerase subunit RPC12/RpoP
MKPEEELKARLMAEMEAEIEKLLEGSGDRGTVTLTEIEQAVEEAGRRIQQRLVERLVEEAAQEQGQERVSCPECGGKLHYKGQKGRWVATTVGEVKVERGYFYCATCGKGVFPPGSEMGNE